MSLVDATQLAPGTPAGTKHYTAPKIVTTPILALVIIFDYMYRFRRKYTFTFNAEFRILKLSSN